MTLFDLPQHRNLFRDHHARLTAGAFLRFYLGKHAGTYPNVKQLTQDLDEFFHVDREALSVEWFFYVEQINKEER
jgi:hypothetical protein